MAYKGASVYDDEKFFNDYMIRRNRTDSPNNLIEKPVLLEMIGDVTDKKILDLGCGDAQFGVELLQRGCFSYEGVEGSQNMVKESNLHLVGMNGTVHHSSMEEWDFPTNTYDIVVSRLALHYISDLGKIFKAVHNSLQTNGKFIFSVQHPVLLASIKSAAVPGMRTDWIVDDYFNSGERVEPWIDKNVVKYHRTIEDYFQLLMLANFTIKDLREGQPRQEHFSNNDEYERRKRIPLFLMLASEK